MGLVAQIAARGKKENEKKIYRMCWEETLTKFGEEGGNNHNFWQDTAMKGGRGRE